MAQPLSAPALDTCSCSTQQQVCPTCGVHLPCVFACEQQQQWQVRCNQLLPVREGSSFACHNSNCFMPCCFHFPSRLRCCSLQPLHSCRRQHLLLPGARPLQPRAVQAGGCAGPAHLCLCDAVSVCRVLSGSWQHHIPCGTHTRYRWVCHNMWKIYLCRAAGG